MHSPFPSSREILISSRAVALAAQTFRGSRPCSQGRSNASGALSRIGIAPPACRCLSCIQWRAAIRKVLPGIAQVPDIGADRTSFQIQRLGYLSFSASFPPKSYKQSVALGFGRTLSRQKFWRRERADMPAHHPGEQPGEADPEGAREPDHRKDPEVAGAALEIDKVAPTHRRPVAEGLLGEDCSVARMQDVLPQAAERRLGLGESALHPERTGSRVPGNPGGDETTPAR
jgi:hypothetical protein